MLADIKMNQMNRREIIKQLSVIPLVGTTMTPDFFINRVSSQTQEAEEWQDLAWLTPRLQWNRPKNQERAEEVEFHLNPKHLSSQWREVLEEIIDKLNGVV